MVDFSKFTVKIFKEFKNDELVIEARISDGTYLLRSPDIAEEIGVLSRNSVERIFEDIINGQVEYDVFDIYRIRFRKTFSYPYGSNDEEMEKIKKEAEEYAKLFKCLLVKFLEKLEDEYKQRQSLIEKIDVSC